MSRRAAAWGAVVAIAVALAATWEPHANPGRAQLRQAARKPPPPVEIPRSLEALNSYISDLKDEDRMLAWRRSEHRITHRNLHLWNFGETVVIQTKEHLAFLNAKTGDPISALPLSSRRHKEGWVSRGPSARTVFVLGTSQIREVEIATGKVVKTWDGDFDYRIEPIPFEGGVVVVQGYRGRTLVRLDAQGEQVWTAAFPPRHYVLVHMAAFGDTLIVQSRGPSYGGQATSGFDLKTGKRLWNDMVDAYGCGVAFSGNGSFMVEGDSWLSGGATEGWVIARKPETGERLWEYRRPGSLRHKPLVTLRGDRVFAVFDTGTVVCLDGRTGAVLWEAPLPNQPPDAAGSYDPQWPIMALDRDRLAVVDGRGYAHFINADSGEVVGSLGVLALPKPDGRSHNYDEVISGPVFVGDRFIVATAKSFKAFSARYVTNGVESPEAQARAARSILLAERGDLDGAWQDLSELQAAVPESPAALDATVAYFRANGDVGAEIIARIRRMRRTGAETDPGLERLTGAVARFEVGHRPTAPVLVGNRVFVGGRNGTVQSFDAGTLAKLGSYDSGVAINKELTHYKGMIIYPTDNRHLRGLDLDLNEVLDFPAYNAHARFFVLGGKLVCSGGYSDAAHVNLLDVKSGEFGKGIKVKDAINRPLIRGEHLFYPMRKGGIAVTDGTSVEYRSPTVSEGPVLLAQAGDRVIAHGTGGVFSVDDNLLPKERISPSLHRTYAAAVGSGAICALSEQRQQTKPWRLQAWDSSGKSLPLYYETHRYAMSWESPPSLQTFGDGFIFVGRELLYVDPRQQQPIWQFWPGALRDAAGPRFKGPVVYRKHVFFTHRDGGLWVFDRTRMTGAPPR